MDIERPTPLLGGLAPAVLDVVCWRSDRPHAAMMAVRANTGTAK